MIKFAVDTEKLKQELRQELEQKLSQKIQQAEQKAKDIIQQAKQEAERIRERAIKDANFTVFAAKETIKEYQQIVNQTKSVIKIVKKHNIRNLANLAKSGVEAGRVAREMKRANKQLIYIDDIKQELERMQPAIENWQKIIAELEKYAKYKKPQQKQQEIEIIDLEQNEEDYKI